MDINHVVRSSKHKKVDRSRGRLISSGRVVTERTYGFRPRLHEVQQCKLAGEQ